MKHGKAAGPDGVPVEAWKVLGDLVKAEGDGTHLPGAVGFMPEMSTTDAIFIARWVMEKYREKRKPCYLAFLDLEKAYDRLARAVIWNALRGRGTPERLITVVSDMYEGSKTAIRTPHGVTRKVDITVGYTKEGSLRTILYADDIALVADNQEELEEKVQLWQRVLADNGLRLNVKKTKFISSEQCAGRS
ncbi:unnamed protein product [Heligmosomoides polygyrus]|uniref:Reverse transcriptase domain-containing protein n=1 Tax=Heligmosomoides polygyrus TaxID=6339 RepID=A0A183F2R4_HELPZ|nr:unnamed protein product [Heligmosomoides polygyrus]